MPVNLKPITLNGGRFNIGEFDRQNGDFIGMNSGLFSDRTFKDKQEAENAIGHIMNMGGNYHHKKGR